MYFFSAKRKSDRKITIGFRREEGIRTLDTVTRILPFQGSSFNHSDTSLLGWQM